MSLSRDVVITGWLFDVYPSSEGVTLWFIDVNGFHHRCHRRFQPHFFLYLNEADTKRSELLGARCPVPLSFTRTTRTEIYSGDSWNVLQVVVHDATKFKEAVRYFERYFPHFAFFNSDILPAQLFLYDADLFLLALGEYEINADGELINWELHDSREAVEYKLPPLSILWMQNANTFVPPKYQRSLQLELAYDGRQYLLEQETPQEVLEALNWHLHRCDPDLILTKYGDPVLLPRLTELASRHRVPLLLNRDLAAGYMTKRESSFFQYGKIVHKDGAFELAGRWHIDEENSFTVGESDLDG